MKLKSSWYSKSSSSSSKSKSTTAKANTNTNTTTKSTTNYIFVFCLLGIGYYLGCQHSLIIASTTQTSTSTTPQSTPQSTQSLPGLNSFASSSLSKRSSNANSASSFQLHEHITLIEDRSKFQKIMIPKVHKLLTEENIKKLKLKCPKEVRDNELQPYIDILINIQQNSSYYESAQNNSNTTNSTNCPVLFLYYYEGGTQMTKTWLEYYSNIKTKQCINFIVNKRTLENQINTTRLLKDQYGYNIIGSKSYVKQDKTISMSLGEIKKQYNDNVVVSVNDLDHLLVWFDNGGGEPPYDRNGTATKVKSKPYRYSTYTDIVMTYIYELLSTPGCPNEKNVHEKYVVPCTCLMHNNDVYESTVIDHTTGIKTPDRMIWSEYGITNRFHPTANFYLNRSQENSTVNSNGTSQFQNNYAYTIGTVYSNLKNYNYDMITHHKIGYKTHKIYARAIHVGIIHARSTNMIQSLVKYHHFLSNQHTNMFRSSSSIESINDALGCSIDNTQAIINNEKKCRKVKEFANILVIGHQKRSCLTAGQSSDYINEQHCISDMTCCLTY
ncbi:hypothetical protein FRACYDRAFT_237384 [Fragilariopsis cylindrus CCMP1102]|uniref:Uncharacterized protein n=1 Tax=Fragilariopsis cylindrus CCMP1102 TaxID=635003 RepID=A0A1E7FLQ5_9STRA|nr:hypothetical protein FRACYDRAFT_237384 [Fragilariopsis cylindrus CCMP1102]|eukprot:OEU19091.1 hypothetical protein FRACYDRAFT_237384 [Fragilariopsis cylindrus CCMP1102]